MPILGFGLFAAGLLLVYMSITDSTFQDLSKEFASGSVVYRSLGAASPSAAGSKPGSEPPGVGSGGGGGGGGGW